MVFPERIEAVDFEFGVMEPPMLYVDIDPDIPFGEQQRFLCDTLVPYVDDVHSSIRIASTAGYDEDCS